MNPSSLILILALIPSQDTGATKAPASEHRHQVDRDGDKAMGFSHEKTTHHFFLRADGGIIQVDANQGRDVESRDQIQQHLGHIATLFAAGDFNIPMLVHSVVPPGSETMKRLKADIQYRYEARPRGGRVVITAKGKEALAAVHEFLRFQIKDHETGDPLEVTVEPGMSH